MRVISGTARGTQLKTIEGLATRPTVDRVKEAIFSTIQFNIREANVLDAFAGSGALGIEALSRGASQATFVDASEACQRIILQNLEKTRLVDKAICLRGDILTLLKGQREAFDLVFLDPPYGQQWCGKVMQALVDYQLLSEDAIVIVEYNADELLAQNYGDLVQIKSYKYGNTEVSRYEYSGTKR